MPLLNVSESVLYSVIPACTARVLNRSTKVAMGSSCPCLMESRFRLVSASKSGETKT